jgi:PPOX class probable F420-dependent enzyme
VPIDPQKLARISNRLEQESNVWLATVRPDGRPHLVPIWFVWHDQKIWICTPPESQKISNIRQNPKATIALEDGNQPVIIEGLAEICAGPEPRRTLSPYFETKYDWAISADTDNEYILFAIAPLRLVSWA